MQAGPWMEERRMVVGACRAQHARTKQPEHLTTWFHVVTPSTGAAGTKGVWVVLAQPWRWS